MAYNIHVQYDGGVDSLQNGVKAIKMVDENGEEQWHYPEGENEKSNQIVTDFIEGKCRSVKHNSVSRIGDYAFYNYESISYVDFPACSYIGDGAFEYCSALRSINFPVCSYIGAFAFSGCIALNSINFPVCSYIGDRAFFNDLRIYSASFPACTYIGSEAFRAAGLSSAIFPACSYIGVLAFFDCMHISTISFPACTYIGDKAFEFCTSLTLISFPACSYIGSHAFYCCNHLRSIYLIGSIVCNLANISAFFSTPIEDGRGSIFVPSYLVSVYKSAANWSYYANRFTAYELE